MRSHIPTLFLIVFVFIFSFATQSYGHGGGHEKTSPEHIEASQVKEPAPAEEILTESSEASLENSIYDESPDSSSEIGLGEYDLGKEDHSEMQDSSPMLDDMFSHDSHEAMDMGGDDHSGHKMKEVELATHEWVSNSRKGYSAAMGITVLAGLVFGFLTLKRPFE